MLADKKLFLKSLRWHWLFLFVGGIFFCAGLFFVSLGYFLPGLDVKLFMYPFCGVFLLVGGFMLYSLASSVLYYYEKALVKKYGDYIEGSIMAIDIRNLDTQENIDVCFLDYKYSYDGKEYSTQEIIDTENIYKYFKIGQSIPLQIMTLKPEICRLRTQKYKNMYEIKNV